MRGYLIALSLKYNGEYHQIKKAILNKEAIEPVECKDCFTIFDKEYPKAFKQLKEAPYVLYYRGDLSLLKEEIIAIVGSRKASDYALNATAYLASIKEEVIVSGLAKGVDKVAHLNARRSIGILGCGIDYIYPKENEALIKYMKTNQLVLSEYPFNVKPYAYHFPFRNRLIVALAKELYVMQSSLKSGTMTSVEEALNQNKEVFVLPYRLFDEEGKMNNQLIQEGASMINN